MSTISVLILKDLFYITIRNIIYIHTSLLFFIYYLTVSVAFDFVTEEMSGEKKWRGSEGQGQRNEEGKKIETYPSQLTLVPLHLSCGGAIYLPCADTTNNITWEFCHILWFYKRGHILSLSSHSSYYYLIGYSFLLFTIN